MYTYTQGHSRLISIGTYIPDQRVTSRELMQEIDSKNRFGIGYDWLERTTGVKERRVADDIPPSQMAARAVREALDLARLDPKEIDVIIYAGITRDFVEPATAHVVQAVIGAKNALAFDVTNACHGFMNGLHLMDALIATGQARRGLIVAGEKICRYTRMAVDILKSTTDRDTFLRLASGLALGDAGAAMLVGPKIDPDTGFMGFMLQSQGEHYSHSVCGRDGKDTPLEADMGPLIEEGIRLSSQLFREFMNRLKWTPESISGCAQHQASRKMLAEFSKYSGISSSIIAETVGRFGNLGTANVPVSLQELTNFKRLNAGDKVLLTGGGSGIAISNAGLVWDIAA